MAAPDLARNFMSAVIRFSKLVAVECTIAWHLVTRSGTSGSARGPDGLSPTTLSAGQRSALQLPNSQRIMSRSPLAQGTT